MKVYILDAFDAAGVNGTPHLADRRKRALMKNSGGSGVFRAGRVGRALQPLLGDLAPDETTHRRILADYPARCFGLS